MNVCRTLIGLGAVACLATHTADEAASASADILNRAMDRVENAREDYLRKLADLMELSKTAGLEKRKFNDSDIKAALNSEDFRNLQADLVDSTRRMLELAETNTYALSKIPDCDIEDWEWDYDDFGRIEVTATTTCGRGFATIKFFDDDGESIGHSFGEVRKGRFEAILLDPPQNLDYISIETEILEWDSFKNISQ